jgi:small neutral amino acid transporter SnatA (MarC family)
MKEGRATMGFNPLRLTYLSHDCSLITYAIHMFIVICIATLFTGFCFDMLHIPKGDFKLSVGFIFYWFGIPEIIKEGRRRRQGVNDRSVENRRLMGNRR